MCDPVTGTLAGIGAVAGIGGSVMQGLNARAASRYNGRVADDAAEQELAAGAFDEQRSRDQARRKLAAQKSEYTASGVLADSGSPDAVAADDTAQAELDALAIRYGAKLRARGYKAQAKSERLMGSGALSGSLFSAGSTLATQGAQLYLAYHPPSASSASAARGGGSRLVAGGAPRPRGP